MKTMLIASILFAGAALTASAQVDITTEQSKDKSSSSSQVVVSTPDRTFVPMTVETKKVSVDASTEKTESTTRALQSDGTYFDWRSTKAESKKLSDTTTERTSDTVETDRQGGSRVLRSTTERITKGPDGSEQATSSQYHRNSSGDLVLENQSSAVSRPNPDGTISTARVNTKPDANGNLVPMQRIDEVTTKVSDKETKTDKTIQTANHLDGGFTPSARESVIVQKDGNSTTTETVIQKPSGNSWQTAGRITTTETKAADGTIQRETVEQTRPAFAQGDQSAGSTGPLVPQKKTVEREVRRPDGTIVTEREVLHRDINGDWKPESFSTVPANKGY